LVVGIAPLVDGSDVITVGPVSTIICSSTNGTVVVVTVVVATVAILVSTTLYLSLFELFISSLNDCWCCCWTVIDSVVTETMKSL
jgi:hypothetical protein